MADPNKKRITIYLDLNIESDKMIWDFFDGKRKNEIIRPVLLNYVNGIPNVSNSKSTNDTIKVNDVSDKSNVFYEEEIELFKDIVK